MDCPDCGKRMGFYREFEDGGEIYEWYECDTCRLKIYRSELELVIA